MSDIYIASLKFHLSYNDIKTYYFTCLNKDIKIIQLCVLLIYILKLILKFIIFVMY